MAIKNKILTLKKDFDMNSTHTCLFHHSQWETCREGEHVSVLYLSYRIAFMVTFITCITYSTLCQSYLFQIFLTNWSFTLQTLYGVLFVVNILWKKCNFLLFSCHRNLRHIYPETGVKPYELKEANGWGNAEDKGTNEDRKDTAYVHIENMTDEQLCSRIVLTTDSSSHSHKRSDTAISSNNNNKNVSPSVLEKVIWILMNVVHVLPHIVVLGYWIFVYKHDPDQPSCERFRSHYIVHGATSVFALIDSLIVAVPARKTHFVFPTFLLFSYGLFSYIYEIAGGPYRNGKEYIYAILNWRHHPERTILLLTVGVTLSPLMHLVTCWGVHHLRLKLVSLWKRK